MKLILAGGLLALAVAPTYGQTKTTAGAHRFFSEVVSSGALGLGVREGSGNFFSPKIIAVADTGRCQSDFRLDGVIRQIRFTDDVAALKRLSINWSKVTEVTLKLNEAPGAVNFISVYGGTAAQGEVVLTIASQAMAKRIAAAAEFLHAQCAPASSSGF